MPFVAIGVVIFSVCMMAMLSSGSNADDEMEADAKNFNVCIHCGVSMKNDRLSCEECESGQSFGW